MARGVSFGSVMTAIARDMARASRKAAAAQKRREREAARQSAQAHRNWVAAQKEAERASREAERSRIKSAKDEERARVQAAKQARQEYLEERANEVEELNKELASTIEDLRSILEFTLDIDDSIAFDSLLIKDKPPAFSPPQELTRVRPAPNREEVVSRMVKMERPVFQPPPPPTGISKLIPGATTRYQKQVQQAKVEHATEDARYRNEVRKAEASYLETKAQWDAEEVARDQRLQELRAAHEQEMASFSAKVEQRRLEVEELEKTYRAGEATAIVAYDTMVLERSHYPDDFPQEFRLAYVPESKELVIEYELPPPGIVPTVEEHKYNKTKDTIDEKPRKASEIGSRRRCA